VNAQVSVCLVDNDNVNSKRVLNGDPSFSV
jgi:hypothetical protein